MSIPAAEPLEQHTPSPWHVEGDDRSQIAAITIRGADGVPVALVYRSHFNKHSQFNARVIVASPLMLAGLRAVHEQLVKADLAASAQALMLLILEASIAVATEITL